MTYKTFRTSSKLSVERSDGRARNHSTGTQSQATKSIFDDAIVQEKEKQTRAPWHREGSSIPPVARQRSAGAMTKGKHEFLDFHPSIMLIRF